VVDLQIAKSKVVAVGRNTATAALGCGEPHEHIRLQGGLHFGFTYELYNYVIIASCKTGVHRAMSYHLSALRLRPDSNPTANLPRIPPASNLRRHGPVARIKHEPRKPRYNPLVSCLAASPLVLSPATSHAAAAPLPWDQTLLALQNMLVGTVAPAAIGFAFAGSVLLYALGGRDEQAGRLLGSAIGGLIALAIVHLLNYLAF